MAESKPTMNMTPEQLAEIAAISATKVAQELRKPDPATEAQRERNRLRIREERARAEEARRQREENCAHRRSDGTSTIAWMSTPAPDNLTLYTRGVCQRCNRLVQPDDPDFRELLRIPYGIPGVTGF